MLNAFYESLFFKQRSVTKTLRIVKLTAIILVTCCIQVSAKVNSQGITLNVRNASLSKVFNEIKKQTGYTFMYTETMLKESNKVSIDVKNSTLQEALAICFLNQPFTYKIINKTVVVQPKGMSIIHTNNIAAFPPPPIEIHGKVVNQQGEPLQNVSVLIVGTNVGTATNNDGNFTLTAPDNKNIVLEVSSVGYQTKRVNVGKQTEVNVALEVEVSDLSDVVVVGYGTQKKSLLTGAISSVSADDIKQVSNSRAEDLLQGRVAGVYSLPISGSPGTGVQVRIRGTGSNGDSQPLYIVDGMRTKNADYLSPSDIQSIEVLKDAASSAIYGAEGANGVVLITTKSGAKSPSEGRIIYDGQFAMQSYDSKIKLMNLDQWMQFREEGGFNAGSPITPEEIAMANGGTDWMKFIMFNAPKQNHSLSFTGRTDKSSYYVGGTLYSQEGIIGGPKSKFNRYTFRVNSDHKIRPWLTVQNRIVYSHVNSSKFSEDTEFGGLVYGAFEDPATPPVYLDNNNLPNHVVDAINQGYQPLQTEDGHYYGISRFTNDRRNPLAQLEKLSNSKIVGERLLGNFSGVIDIMEGLNLTTRFGIDYNFNSNHSWEPPFWFSPQLNQVASVVRDSKGNGLSWQFENYASYTKKINDHTFSGMAGMSALKNYNSGLSGSSIGMFRLRDKFAYSSYTTSANDQIDGSDSYSKLESYYGRLGYDFKGKYIFNGTLRRDGSSLLPSQGRWGTFPSASIGWVISKENFFKSNFINFVKLRGSWGQNGSISNLTIGGWQSNITATNIRYTSANGVLLQGAEPDFLANPELKWETSEQLDLGLDMSFFNSSLTFSMDVYNKKTNDLLTPGAPPNFAGLAIPRVNAGNVENKGVEFELGYRSSLSDFKYEVSVNGSYLKNEVTFLNPLYPRIAGAGLGTGWTATAFEIGYPVWYFRGYKTEGVFQTQAQIDEYLAKNHITGWNPKPGDVIVVDVNGDGILGPSDQTYIGKPLPDFVYGWRASFNYKNFDFLIFGQGQFGNDILMGLMRTDGYPNTNKPEFFFTEAWRGPGTSNKYMASGADRLYALNSDMLVSKGDFMRIKQLMVGYTLPKRVFKNSNRYNLRFYISLNDYFTFTGYRGFDPEAGSTSQNSQGIDRGVFPHAKEIAGGLTFEF